MNREEAAREAMLEAGVPVKEIDEMTARRVAHMHSMPNGYAIERAGKEEITPEEFAASKARMSKFIAALRANIKK